MVKDRWIRAAMSDDMLVVDLLVRLKQSQDSSFLKSSSPSSATPMIPLRWSLRLPRSRAVRCDVDSQRKKSDSARCSPTTPLSWSGGAFPSATADGFEESSHLRSQVSSLSFLFNISPSSYSPPLFASSVSLFVCGYSVRFIVIWAELGQSFCSFVLCFGQFRNPVVNWLSLTDRGCANGAG